MCIFLPLWGGSTSTYWCSAECMWVARGSTVGKIQGGRLRWWLNEPLGLPASRQIGRLGEAQPPGLNFCRSGLPLVAA